MDTTRYLLKVHSIEVSTLPVSKEGSTIDIQCASFCDTTAKKLALQLSNTSGFVNLLEEEDKETKSLFLKEVPIWGTFVLAVGCYLLGATTRKPAAEETLNKINRAAKAVEGLALVLNDLAEASTWAGNVLGTKANPETVDKIRTSVKAVAEVAAVVKEMTGK